MTVFPEAWSLKFTSQIRGQAGKRKIFPFASWRSIRWKAMEPDPKWS